MKKRAGFSILIFLTCLTLFILVFSAIIHRFAFFESYLLKNTKADEVEIISDYPIPKSYSDIIDEGGSPFLEPGFIFPVSPQYRNGCFAFAINHILDYKYEEKIDLYDAEKKIAKPRKELWTREYILSFLNEYNLTLSWYRDTDTFFEFLKGGEAVLIQYQYPLPNNKWVGHFVAAYSFDKEGVWVSDSISNNLIRVDYTDIFEEEGFFLKYSFARLEKASNDTDE